MARTKDDGGISRRDFVGGVVVGSLGVAVIGCGDDAADPADSGEDGGAGADTGTPGDGGSADGAPVWMTVPTIQFVEGVPSTVSLAEYVSDPDGDELTITLNDVPLPAGVTFDAAAMEFVYDGSGPSAMTSGHVLTADDG